MSDQTRAAMEDAIRAHVADECDGKILVGFELVTAQVRMEDYGDGSASYQRWPMSGQQWHASEGLLDVGARLMGDEWDRFGEDG